MVEGSPSGEKQNFSPWLMQMTQTPLVVIGASAGGIEALRSLGPTLPADFNAAVAIVLHRQPVEEDERLPRVLARDCRLPVAHARDGEPIEAGRVYVGPADVHLQVFEETFILQAGPKENGSRPAIDVLFRSAAHYGGPQVAGVVLSGMLDDGTAGLAAIKAHGGLALVQDPGEAIYGDMPRNAIESVDVDAVLPLSAMAESLVSFASRARRTNNTASKNDMERSQPSSFSCPDCGGVLWEVAGKAARFRCRTGHAYSPSSLHMIHRSKLEEALWASIRSLEEHAELTERLSERLRSQSLSAAAERLKRQAHKARERANVVRLALPNSDAALLESDVGEASDAEPQEV